MVIEQLTIPLAPLWSWSFERGVKDPVERCWRFKDTRERVSSFMEELEPAVAELQRINLDIDRPLSETSEFVRLIDKGKKLLDSCRKGNQLTRFLKRSNNTAKLEKLEKSLERACSVQGVRRSRDVAEVLCLMRQIFPGVHSELVRSSDDDGGLRVIGAPCEPSKPPEFTVGLGVVMEELKWKILEENGSKVIVLTAPPGLGKTTLAQKLCQDQKIKGKFNTNIMFVTVSETPDLHRMMEDLYSHNRLRSPQVEKKKDPSNELRIVLEEIGKRPLLLVLDDVWPISENLVRKFSNLDIPDYKILVTSRYEFPQFGQSLKLQKLNDDDSFALFCHHAISKHVDSEISDEIMKNVASQCKNIPLALELIGASLCGNEQQIWKRKLEEWSRGESSVLESEDTLLEVLRRSLKLLPLKDKLEECFIDLCLFPEDQRIAASILIDVWTELHCLTEKGAAANLYNLRKWNLAHMIITRSDADEDDGDYSEHFLTTHDMLRELAIYESKKEDSQTKRLIVHLRGNNLPDNSKRLDAHLVSVTSGIFARLMSITSGLSARLVSIASGISARLVSITYGLSAPLVSTSARLVSITSDGPLPSEWCNIQLPETEVLILNFHEENYKIPEFVKSMAKLKLLILTNQSYFKAKLTDFELLDSLAHLKTIRLEGIDIASLSETRTQLKNLHKLSFVMCTIGQAFSSVAVSELLKSLTELNIHYCNDLTTLPSGLKKLKKLRVTRCPKLSSLPRDIGEMENLEELKLRSCIGLEKLPESICKLSKLKSLDISECFSVRDLPEKIGNLGCLESLNIKGCSRLQCFPQSILELEESLKDVACDEDMEELLKSHLTSRTKMNIRVPKEYINLNGL